jgi:hypothetical protein
VLSMVGDVPVDSKVPIVTLSIFADSVFEDAPRGRICTRVFIGMSAHACVHRDECVCVVSVSLMYCVI